MTKKIIETISNSFLLLLFFMAAVSYNGKLFGHNIEELLSTEKKEILPPSADQLMSFGLANAQLKEESQGIWSIMNSSVKNRIVSTIAFSKGVYGYGGPVAIYFLINENNRILRVQLANNNETPEFVESVVENGIVSQWEGKTYATMSDSRPDIVSGATMTSNAINHSILKSLEAIEYVSNKSYQKFLFDIKTIVAFITIVFGIFISVVNFKRKKHLRLIVLIANTVILGFWCGKFISLNIVLAWVENGMNIFTSAIVFFMLLLAIVMPLFFKKKSYYCNWVCPFGSAQELAGKLNKNKVTISPKLMQVLSKSREVITIAVFVSMWLGLISDIANYEPFAAFIFQHASVAVLLIASLGLLTAIIIPRPWCRFACPTGQVLNWINKMN